MKNKMITGISLRRLASFALLLALCVIAALPTYAYPAHTDYIKDEATVLDEGTENTVRELSEKLLDAKGARIAVCTVLNTGNESAEAFAAGVFKEWKVGHGVLILIVTESDTFYAVQSNSVAEVLTNEKLSDIVNSTIEPRFAEKDYSGGVSAAANALSTFMTENLPDGLGDEGGGFPGWLSVILKIILVLAILIIVGYALLVYFERKQAERRLAMLEERRRRMAREGRGAYRPTASNMQRRGAYPPRQVPNGALYSAQQRNRSEREFMPCEGGMRQATGQFNPAEVRRRSDNYPRYDADNAATIQINTADIRAARGGRDKFAYPEPSYRQQGNSAYRGTRRVQGDEDRLS